MARVEVFVDDAVRGDLPLVCVLTGEPTDLVVREEVPVGGGLGALWLLLFLGPIGWLVLVLVALTRRPATLTVRLPMSDASFERLQGLRRSLRFGVALVGVGVLGSIAIIVTDLPTGVLLVPAAIALAGFVISIAARVTLAFREVGVSLDASGRWVTLRGVDPAFASAVRATRHPSPVDHRS